MRKGLLLLVLFIIPIVKAEILEDSTYKVEITISDFSDKLEDSTYSVGISSESINDRLEDSTYSVYFGFWYPGITKLVVEEAVTVPQTELERDEAEGVGRFADDKKVPITPKEVVDEIKEYIDEYINKSILSMKYKINVFLPVKMALGPNPILARVEGLEDNEPDKVYFYLTKECDPLQILESNLAKEIKDNLFHSSLTIGNKYEMGKYCVTIKVIEGDYIESTDIPITVELTWLEKFIALAKITLVGTKNVVIEKGSALGDFIQYRIMAIINFIKELLYGIK